ncbi:MAG: N-acetylmuramoyl-L-alanine amidase [Wenzhouxiangellaceae bacterium]
MTLRVTQRPLPYVDRLEARDPASVRGVVIHATELPDLATARSYGERIVYPGSGTGNSGHYYIARDGRVERWVPADRVAHHVRGHNADTIGIELDHPGRWPDWYRSTAQAWTEPYTEVQLEALEALLACLRAELPRLEWIAGHDQLDLSQVPASDDPQRQVRRKLDPGPNFPWARILAASGLTRYPGHDAR